MGTWGTGIFESDEAMDFIDSTIDTTPWYEEVDAMKYKASGNEEELYNEDVDRFRVSMAMICLLQPDFDYIWVGVRIYDYILSNDGYLNRWLDRDEIVRKLRSERTKLKKALDAHKSGVISRFSLGSFK